MVASPNFFTKHQPDGSPVTLRLRGDENSHWITDMEDFIVLQTEDGTYVYAIEQSAEEADSNDSIIHQNTKLVPSETDIVGKLDPTALYEEVGAERLIVNKLKKSNDTLSRMKLARHHPTRLSLESLNDTCFKRFCGGIPEPISSRDNDKTPNRERHLRNQNPDIDDIGTAQFHRRQSALPTMGTIKHLVVLLQFRDHEKARRSLPDHDELERLTDSLTDLYLENSFGKLTVESTIVPQWYTTAYNESWYAEGKSGTTNLHEAMREALDYLEENDIIDFLDYDGNEDGYVDTVTFLHSGYGAEHGGTDCTGQDYRNRIWTHQWQLFGDRDGNNVGPWASNSTDYRGESIKIWNYQMVSALKGICGGSPAPVGAIAHEFGHALGLPDLSSGGGNGLGSFCLMADPWGFDRTLERPSHMSAWAKMKLGWLEAHTPKPGFNTIAFAEETSEEIQLYKVGDGAFHFPTDEYLLIEYRARRGMDHDLPGEGLLIYHVDESPSVPDNINEGHPWQEDDWPRNGKHYRVALVQADRLYSLERGINSGGERDFFRADYIDSLVPSLDATAPWDGPFPNTDSYQNGVVYQTGVKICDISTAGYPAMTFLFLGNPEEKISTIGNAPSVPFRGKIRKGRRSEIGAHGNIARFAP